MNRRRLEFPILVDSQLSFGTDHPITELKLMNWRKSLQVTGSKVRMLVLG